MKRAITQIQSRLPLNVDAAEWQDPVLLIRGADWNLSVMSPWRIIKNGRLFVGSDDADALGVAELLSGNVITGCKPQGAMATFDPAFVFSSGHVLEIFAVSALEPWVLRLGHGGTYVASPSE